MKSIMNSVMSKLLPASTDEPGQQVDDHKSAGHKACSVMTNGGLLVVVIGGGALLAWWALSFHHSNEQLWMVPVGLVLLGTPIVIWLSVFASGVFWILKNTRTAAPPPPSLDTEG
ncbi:hypothetical protein Cni_G16241 [Canna indica]|uniref:Transmembrane protein n=1 Tax=Canna indica TaxID=4628 RepID=A0AAQ3QE11_9LILI|nr:hypothetical protein Cni_G16241 [Canna indica]